MLWCQPCSYPLVFLVLIQGAMVWGLDGFSLHGRKATEFLGAVLANMTKEACDASLNGLPQLTDAERP